MGLLFPSRKTADVFTPRTGSYIAAEKAIVRTFSGSGTGSVGYTTTLFSVPAGYKATIVSWAVVANGNGGDILVALKVDGNVFWYGTAPSSTWAQFHSEKPYIEGATAYSDFKATITTISGATNSTTYVAGTYILEPAGEGYFRTA